MGIKDFSFMKQPNKKNLVAIVVGAVVLILLIFLLLSPSDKAKNAKQLSETFEQKQQEQNTSVSASYNPPPILDNKQNTFDDKAIENIKNGNFNQSADSTKDEIEKKIADLSQSQQNVIDQSEAMKMIEKKQKPKDMIVFLKSNKSKIELFNYKNIFKYELKDYKVGDKFLDWYLIEDINDNFIRFKDTDYAYNLRFIEE
ncbi:hypothetical protein [Campylobacter vicugnae]|uniref:hypothetical protein n=1 Tax=Campylobacter vicugnae TaxID=1660076 RepID=UPI000A3332DD|nr:hypothetical protein [Campylobacter sp. S0112]